MEGNGIPRGTTGTTNIRAKGTSTPTAGLSGTDAEQGRGKGKTSHCVEGKGKAGKSESDGKAQGKSKGKARGKAKGKSNGILMPGKGKADPDKATSHGVGVSGKVGPAKAASGGVEDFG